MSEFLQKVEDILKDDASLKRLPKIEKEMTDLQRRKEKLLDLRLDNNIDRDIYDKKNQELSEQLKKLQAEQLQLVELSKNQESTKTRIREFRKNLNSGELLESFDRVVFESVVERIIIGGYNDEGVEDPLKITFVYKTGIHSILMQKILSQSVKTLRLYIRTQNCVPMQVSRITNCVYIVAPTHIETVVLIQRKTM